MGLFITLFFWFIVVLVVVGVIRTVRRFPSQKSPHEGSAAFMGGAPFVGGTHGFGGDGGGGCGGDGGGGCG
jgi:hypothetical protein